MRITEDSSAAQTEHTCHLSLLSLEAVMLLKIAEGYSSLSLFHFIFRWKCHWPWRILFQLYQLCFTVTVDPLKATAGEALVAKTSWHINLEALTVYKSLHPVLSARCGTSRVKLRLTFAAHGLKRSICATVKKKKIGSQFSIYSSSIILYINLVLKAEQGQ